MRDDTILVADDDEDIRDLIATKLRTAGYRVLTAADGTSALRVAETRLPDAIVLDVAMPGLDGFAICYRLQQLRATIAMPMIMVSGQASGRDVELAHSIGADDYLPKPVHPAQLVQRLGCLLAAAGR